MVVYRLHLLTGASMVRKAIWSALALALALHAGAAGAARAQTTEAAFKTTTLNLSAQGETHIKPDIVRLTLGVSTEAATAQAASAEGATRLAAVTQALRRAGVEPRDLQTRSLQLSPRYSDRNNAPREIVGYLSITTVEVSVRDLTRAGALLDRAVTSGANLVLGVSFGLQDPAAAQRQARDMALRTLQEDAVRIAGALDERVVRLVSISTSAYSAPAVEYRMAQPVVLTGSRVEPGELTVRGSANGVFEIAPQ
ncbi:SIMPL domain-containing protein [Phenylobacterium hankyongense]|nr:SIMPL domain-containing protein [Phenylobacterium hankyongense]